MIAIFRFDTVVGGWGRMGRFFAIIGAAGGGSTARVPDRTTVPLPDPAWRRRGTLTRRVGGV